MPPKPERTTRALSPEKPDEHVHAGGFTKEHCPEEVVPEKQAGDAEEGDKAEAEVSE